MTRVGRALVHGAGLVWIAAAIGGAAYIWLYESWPALAAQATPDAVGPARSCDADSPPVCSPEIESCPVRGSSPERLD